MNITSVYREYKKIQETPIGPIYSYMHIKNLK